MPASHQAHKTFLLYTPTLHRELAPAHVPSGVLFMHPGLPGSMRADQWRPASYPMSASEAKSVLAELLALGQSVALADNPGLWAAAPQPSGRALPPEEEAALLRFTVARDAREQGLPLAAQQTLLLTWDLEERLLELEALRRQVTEAGKALAASLGDDDEPENDFFLPLDTGVDEPAWQTTLAAMAAFLPPEAILVTAHARMRQDLTEAGLLSPLPPLPLEGISLDSWPPELRAASLWAKAPLWRLLGRTRQPENKPQLSHSPTLLVCPAA